MCQPRAGASPEKLVDLERLSHSLEVTQKDMGSRTKRGTKVPYPLPHTHTVIKPQTGPKDSGL